MTTTDDQRKKRIEREQGDVNTTPNREKYWGRNLAGEARTIFEDDKTFFMQQALSTPVLNVLSSAQGAHIIDMQGRSYLDMHGNGVHNAGFNNPEVLKAVIEQLESGLTFCPRRYTNQPAVDLARKLAHITPAGLCKSLFCPGGSEAIEMAITLAKQATGKFKTISFWDSFHGAGYAAASVGGEAHFKGGMGPMMPGALHVEFPNYFRNPWGFENQDDVDAECLRQIELILEREPGIAAIIGEPISATPVAPSQAYWAGVGLHMGIELVRDPATKERAVDEAEIIMYKCMQKGLAFKTIEGNVITLRPALVITREEMDQALDILEMAIGEVEKGGQY